MATAPDKIKEIEEVSVLEHQQDLELRDTRIKAIIEAQNMKKKYGYIQWKTIEKKYAIARSKLEHYIDKDTIPRTVKESNRSRGKLNAEEESGLLEWIYNCNASSDCPSMQEFLDRANMLYLYRVSKGCNDSSKPLTIKWARNWVTRNPFLVNRTFRVIQQCLLDGYTRENCENYFERLAQWSKTDPDLIYNFDETGFSVGDTSKLRSSGITLQSSNSTIPIRAHSGRRGWLTVIETIRADGESIEPLIISKSTAKNGTVEVENKTGYSLAHTPTGWSNNSMGLEYVKHFNRLTWRSAMKNGEQRYRVLIFDGHASHCSEEFVQFCLENKIIAVMLPPHTSWKLQPLDVAVFSSYKRVILTAQAALFSSKRKINGNKTVSVSTNEFIELIVKNREKALTKDNIRSGFRATGISPFDENFIYTIPKQDENVLDIKQYLIKGSSKWIKEVLRIEDVNDISAPDISNAQPRSESSPSSAPSSSTGSSNSPSTPEHQLPSSPPTLNDCTFLSSDDLRQCIYQTPTKSKKYVIVLPKTPTSNEALSYDKEVILGGHIIGVSTANLLNICSQSDQFTNKQLQLEVKDLLIKIEETNNRNQLFTQLISRYWREDVTKRKLVEDGWEDSRRMLEEEGADRPTRKSRAVPPSQQYHVLTCPTAIESRKAREAKEIAEREKMTKRRRTEQLSVELPSSPTLIPSSSNIYISTAPPLPSFPQITSYSPVPNFQPSFRSVPSAPPTPSTEPTLNLEDVPNSFIGNPAQADI